MERDKSKVDSSLIDESVRPLNFIEERKRLLHKIILSFQIDSSMYDETDSIKAIEEFLLAKSLMGRISYYEITTAVFRADDQSRDQMVTNIEKLVERVCGNQESDVLSKIVHDKAVEDKCRETILKISDHIHLASFQVTSITQNAINQSQQVFTEEIKKTERNYITILGIFASIITVSIGGFNYVGKVFDAVGNAKNIPALIGLTTIMGIVLVSISSIMVNLIFSMVDKDWKWERVIYPSIGVVIAGIVMYLLSYLLPLFCN